MKILMLSQFFEPEPRFKGLSLAQALRARGHEVEILTGFPNYPTGEVFPGYKIRPWTRETMAGIRVNRVALYPSHDRSAVRRAANYLSFGTSAALLGPWLVRRPDVIHVYNLPTLGPAAGLIRALRGARIVLDLQDLWPESVAGSGMMGNKVLLQVLERWCRAEYHRPDRLSVQSPGFMRNLIGRGVPPENIDVVYNWCDESALRMPVPDPALARQLAFTGRFNVTFAGTIGIMQALDCAIAAARRLLTTAPEVLFTFVGSGVDVDRLRQLAHGLPNVQFLPHRPASEVAGILAISDVLLVHLKDDPLFSITIPSKTQAYLYAGKPILCGLRGDAADLVRQAGAGLCFTPEDPESLASGVLAMRDLGESARRSMGESGSSYYRRHLSFEQGVLRTERSLLAALKPRR